LSRYTQGRSRLPTSIPSWSWASTNGVIESFDSQHGYIKVYSELVDIVDVQVYPFGDPFGHVAGGTLELRSKLLVPAEIKVEKDENWAKQYIHVGGDRFSGELFSDNSGADGGPCIMVPFIGSGDKYSVVFGLCLRHTGDKNGQYQRLGLFTYYEPLEPSARSRLMKQLLDDQPISRLPEPWAPGSSLITEADYDSVEINEHGTKYYTITVI